MAAKKIAVVTGGAGFIGSHMVDCLLERDYKVRVLDNLVGGRIENLEQHRSNAGLSLDSRDILSVSPNDSLFKEVSYVFHFAGIGDIVPSIEHPTAYMLTNVQGTVNMLECARCHNIQKFVYAASSSCYGLAETPTNESHPINPRYPYALSKFQGEQSALHWHATYRLPVNSIRIFNAFGTRSRTSGAYGAVFGVFLRQKLAGKPYTVVGDGTQSRDFLFVTDVAQAFLSAAETRHTGRIYNLGAGSPRSINSLVALLGGDSVHIPKRPGEPDCTWADITRITRELGWKPSVSFEDGVAKVLSDIDYWRHAPLWDPSSIADATKIWFKFVSDS